MGYHQLASCPNSYVVGTNHGEYRWNAKHIIPGRSASTLLSATFADPPSSQPERQSPQKSSPSSALNKATQVVERSNLLIYICKRLVFVCVFATTQHIKLKFCMHTIYDDEREIRYLKLTSEVALISSYLFILLIFHPLSQNQTSVFIIKLSQAMFSVMTGCKRID